MDGSFLRLHGSASLRWREAEQRPRREEPSCLKEDEKESGTFCLPLLRLGLLTPSFFFQRAKKRQSILRRAVQSLQRQLLPLFSRQRLFFLFSFSPRDGQRRYAYVEKRSETTELERLESDSSNRGSVFFFPLFFFF